MIRLTIIFLSLLTIISAGFFLKRYLIQNRLYWQWVDYTVYYFLLPLMLFNRLADIDLQANDINLVLKVIFSVVTIVAIIVSIVNYLWKERHEHFTSIFQGSIRPNVYLGLAIATALYGEDGTQHTLLIIAVFMPIVNVYSIIVFAWVQQGHLNRIVYGIKYLVTNPLILGCVMGIIVNYLDIPMPSIFNTLVSFFATPAIILSLLSIGSALILRQLQNLRSLIESSFLKLLVLPFLAYIFSSFLLHDPIQKVIVVLFAALPCAPSSYILSTQLKGNYVLMANIITIQLLASFLTLPLTLNFISN